MKVINFRVPIKELGGSLYIPIRKDIREELCPENPKLITEGLMVSGKLWVVEVKEISCPKCKSNLTTYEDEDAHDCPTCGHEFRDVDLLEVEDGK